MTDKAPLSGNELAAAVYKRYSRGMYILLIMAGVLAILAAVVVYCLVAVHFSDFTLVIVVGVAAVLIFASAAFVFNSGTFSAIRHYEPKIYRLLEEAGNFDKAFDEYRNSSNIGLAILASANIELKLFIKERSPGLLEEFEIWKSKRKRDDSSPETMDE